MVSLILSFFGARHCSWNREVGQVKGVGTWLMACLLVGFISGFPPKCMALYTTLASSCEVPGVVNAAVCGKDCLRYEGVDPVIWDWYVNMTQAKLSQW